MPGGLISVFGDREDFQAAMGPEGFVGLLVTGRGHFRAHLTRVSLHGLHLAAGEEELSRIAFVALPSSSVMVSLAIGGGSPPVWAGIEPQPGEMVTIAPGERFHARTVGPCRWATMLVSERDLMRYGRALTGAAFSIPPGIARWRPAPSGERYLRQLHRAAVQMAEARSGVLADAAAAHGLEQQLLHALIDCLGVGPVCREPPAARRHRDILARFETVLQTDVLQSSADICAALGVSPRLLRECCKAHLGTALSRYTRLHRMQQVHGALRYGDPNSTKIAELAEQHGFHDPGRFANNYRAVYGESPSVTLRRRSLDARRSSPRVGHI